MFSIALQLRKIEDIYPWLRETIFPNIYPFHAYNGEILSGYDQQFIANIDGLLMGPVRMKQNRDEESKIANIKQFCDLGLPDQYSE